MAIVDSKYLNQFQEKLEYLAPDTKVEFIPSPVGGWDALSPLAAMEPQYAVILDNWVPRTGFCEIRGGYNAWVQGLVTDTSVNTLMTYRPPLGSEILFAAIGTQIWNASTYGNPSLSLSGLGGNKWQFVNFTPGGGSSYLLCVNGVDTYRAYSGTWTIPTITGPSSADFIDINVHKRRIFFIKKNSTDAYYLTTDAIQGAATSFPLGALMTKGGRLVSMGTWTVDGGNGPDDLAVWVTSEGQYIVYKGTDITNANAWALVGVFDGESPIGQRCFTKLGSDLLVITQAGILPISKALPFDPSGERSVAITNRIQTEFINSSTRYGSLFGWQTIPFPNQALVITNVPISEGAQQVQYVMNAVTGAWCKFTGWNANCFEIFNDSLYFGDNKGNVNLAYAGGLDLVAPILADMKCAFNYFNEPGRVKTMNFARPLIVADGTLTPTIAVDVDFGDSSPSATVTILTPSGAVWDVSKWDASSWSGGTVTVTNWFSVNGLGTALAMRLQVNLSGGGSSSSASQQSVFDSGVFGTMVFDGNGATLRSGEGVPTLKLNMFEANMQFGGPV